MRDGIYKVTLESGGLKGLIIGTLHDGLVTGCDQTHTEGRLTSPAPISQHGSRVKGTMVLSLHARPEGFVEIVNLDLTTVNFSDICGDSFGQFDAKLVEKPDLSVKAIFQWMCEL